MPLPVCLVSFYLWNFSNVERCCFETEEKLRKTESKTKHPSSRGHPRCRLAESAENKESRRQNRAEGKARGETAQHHSGRGGLRPQQPTAVRGAVAHERCGRGGERGWVGCKKEARRKEEATLGGMQHQ